MRTPARARRIRTDAGHGVVAARTTGRVGVSGSVHLDAVRIVEGRDVEHFALPFGAGLGAIAKARDESAVTDMEAIARILEPDPEIAFPVDEQRRIGDRIGDPVARRVSVERREAHWRPGR